jgi:leader peptidase (prepilin peptidase)/N-methyltransferase
VPEGLYIAYAAVVGLIFGSFATVAAHRIPKRESIVKGRSLCPSCGAKIGARDNVPLLSYLLLRGHCRACGWRIPLRYPAIELTTAALFALCAWRFGLSLTAVVFAGFFWVLVVLTVIDLDHKLLPDRVVYPTFVAGWAGLIAAAMIDGATARLGAAAVGAGVFGGLFFLLAYIYPAGMGGGDVKLAFVLGTFLGYAGGLGAVLAGMFLSFLTGAVAGIVAMVGKDGNRKTQIPFGPFLALGTAIAVFAGEPLARAYLDLL